MKGLEELVTARLHVMLEPYASRGARTDLRGGPRGNLGALPDQFHSELLGIHYHGIKLDTGLLKL